MTIADLYDQFKAYDKESYSDSLGYEVPLNHSDIEIIIHQDSSFSTLFLSPVSIKASILDGSLEWINNLRVYEISYNNKQVLFDSGSTYQSYKLSSSLVLILHDEHTKLDIT